MMQQREKGRKLKSKITSGIMLALLLMGILAFGVQTVTGWTGTVYIRADGRIDPLDAPVSTVDFVTYSLTGNITSTADGIVVERSDVIIDGKGYTVQGTGNYRGIRLTSVHNVTIRETNIKDFYFGIWLYSSSSDSISGNNITANNYHGIWLYSSSNNCSISGNTVAANSEDGIVLYASSGCSISGNNITNNRHGIGLGYSSNSSIFGNTVKANNYYGIWFYSSSNNNSIYGNTVTSNNYSGIWLTSSNYNSISGNNITANNDHGIELYSSNNNCSIYGNTIIANSEDGIVLYASSGCSISGNNITNNRHGIGLGYSSNSNSIFGNTVKANNYYGIWFYSSSNSNSISGNNIANNYYGIWLSSSSSNRFCHNNFIDNSLQVGTDPSGYPNVWDNGYPSGGNYWSSYTDVDEHSGPNQDQPKRDYIWDHPYVIDPDNQDRYPLANMWSVADVNHDGVTSVFDAAAISAHWYPGPPLGPLGYEANYDINNDGSINVLDAAIVSAYWSGPPKGPLAP